MPAPDPAELTILLQQMHHGNHDAGEKAVALVYDELHRIASRELRGERPDHLLQTTALIHEAYTRLVGSAGLEIQSRTHFFRLASQQMRHILVDYARARNAQRRGSGAISVDLDGVQVGFQPRGVDLLLLDESLNELQKVEPRAVQVVELRYFGGYTDKEVMEALGISFAAVRRDWEYARAWLFDRMHGGSTASPPQ